MFNTQVQVEGGGGCASCDPLDLLLSFYKGLVINYGEGGLQNGKIAGPKLFAPPHKTG